MGRTGFIVRIVVLLALIWGAVWGIRHYADSKRVTQASIAAKIQSANFADWSANATAPDSAEAKRREAKLREIANLVNRLDLAERQKSQDQRTLEGFFRSLDGTEKREFVDLTVRESMGQFMAALDKLPPADRRKFVEQGLKEIQKGRTAEDIARAQELGGNALESITNEGMRAYFEKANADTKLDLAPLMDAVNEVMQGLQKKEIFPGAQ